MSICLCPSGLGGNVIFSVPNYDRGLIFSIFATCGCCHPCFVLNHSVIEGVSSTKKYSENSKTYYTFIDSFKSKLLLYRNYSHAVDEYIFLSLSSQTFRIFGNKKDTYNQLNLQLIGNMISLFSLNTILKKIGMNEYFMLMLPACYIIL